jgi:hypothetical protein
MGSKGVLSAVGVGAFEGDIRVALSLSIVFKEVLVQLIKLGGKRISDFPSKPQLPNSTAPREGTSPASEFKPDLAAELVAPSA